MVYIVDMWIHESEKIDLNNMEVVSTKEFTGTADLEILVERLTELEKQKSKYSSNTKLEKALEKPIELKEGGTLILENIHFVLDKEDVENIYIKGYVLK